MPRLIRIAALLALTLIAKSALAGTCPAGVPSGVTSCFFASTLGSDTNSGASESSPWLHLPGMSGCSNNCSSHAVMAGDGFILRGGDTWHWNPSSGIKGLPWNTTGAGTAANPIYFGVDHSWWNSSICGASAWCRPILNGDNPLSTSAVGSCSSSGIVSATMLASGTTYGFLDDFEMTGFCWNTNPNPWYTVCYISLGANHQNFQNIYIHGWTHTATADSQGTGVCGGTTTQFPIYNQIVIDGSDSDRTSLAGITFDAYDVHNSVFRYLSNGVVANGVNQLYSNLFEYIAEPYDPAHGNAAEFNNESPSAQHYVYNNLVRHITTAVTFWTCPASANDYYFNNVMYDILSQMWDVAEVDAGCTALTGSANFYDNTLVNGTITVTSSYSHVFSRDNLLISSSFLGTLGAVTNSISLSTSQATTFGYTASTNYAPTSSNCNGNPGPSCPIGAGSNLTSYCSGITDIAAQAACLHDTTGGPNYDSVNHRINGNARTPLTRPPTGAWDVAAYQFSSSVVQAVQPPTNLQASVQ